MSKSPSDLPFGSEFSPSQIDLPWLLSIAAKHAGSLPALEAAIRAKYFASHGGKDPLKADQNQKTLAMNCRLGLQGYGIIDSTGSLTTLGSDLLELVAKQDDLYRTFGQHILLNLNGMRVVQCVLDMEAAGEIITLETLEKALRHRGLAVASISRHLSSMRLWLEKSGIAGKSWQIDRLKLKDVLGAEPDDFPALAGLPPAQRAFLRALVNTGERKPQGADGVRDLAEATFGIDQPKKGFAQQTLKPLEDAGWIAVIKTTGGRGAKTSLIAPTPSCIRKSWSHC